MCETKTERNRLDRLYEFLVEEEDARACLDIPEEACREAAGNFFKIGIAQTLTKLADELANAKTVLPWLLGALGAPSVLVGFLVPVRESVSLLPQLVIAGSVRHYPERTPVWVWGAVLQATTLGLLAGVAVFLRGVMAGIAVITLLLLFSLARGLCSVASKDVIGKTISKRRRGRLVGYTAALSGALTLVLGLLLVSRIGEGATPVLFACLLALGAILWLLAALSFSRVNELPGATEGGKNALREALSRLDLLRTDATFRRFVVVRSLMISTALAGPYYVMLARQSGGGELLGLFVLASGMASAMSSAVWGRFSDRSSRLVLVAAAACASAIGLVLAVFAYTGVLDAGFGWVAPVGFFVLSIAHAGVRIGRKTYILDMAGPENRTDYVAVSNTAIGAVLLASSLLGLLTPLIGAAGMLVLLSVLGVTGSILGLRLPEVE